MAPPRKDFCKRGHDLNANGIQMYRPNGTKNGRVCKLCRKTDEYKKKDAAWHRKKYWDNAFNDALKGL